jgi:uncharacterized membrane protein YphA (DoxX/SURF4 family)
MRGARRGRAAVWAERIAVLLAGMVLVAAAGAKLLLGAAAADRYVGWGIPGYLVYVVGVVEVVLAALLVLPRTRFRAALGVILLMLASLALPLLAGEENLLWYAGPLLGLLVAGFVAFSARRSGQPPSSTP